MRRLDEMVGMEHRGGTAPIPLAYILPGLFTYAISAIDTLTSNAPLGMKLGMLAMSDLASAAFWPIAWIMWITTHFAGMRTPLQSVFGL